MTAKKIGVLGSIAIDNIFEADSVPLKGQRVHGKILGSHVGGIGANQATEMARYTDQVFMLGYLSTDSAGERLQEQFRSRNVRLSHIEKTDLPCGQSYMYLIDNKRDYFSIVAAEANDKIDPAVIEKQVEGLDVLLVSLEINIDAAVAAMRAAKKQGIFVYLCPSPAECFIPEMLQYADAVILNCREAEIILHVQSDTEAMLREGLLNCPKHLKTIVVSRGEMGAIMRHAGNLYAAAAYAVPVLDTVGAGDALTGTVVAMLESGLPPQKALCYGCIAGSLTVAVIGAQSSSHTLNTLSDIYECEYKQREGNLT